MMNRDLALPCIFILLYILITMIVGLLPYGRKRVDTIGAFHLASGEASTLTLVLCIFATVYTGSTWTAWVSLTQRSGIFSCYVIPYLAIAGILYYYVSQRVYPISREKMMLTLGELMRERFNSPKLQAVTGGISFAIGMLWIMMEIITLGYVMNMVFGRQLNLSACYLVGFLIILVYILWGGLESVLWTDCFQGTLTLVGGIVLCAALVSFYFGTPENLLRAFLAQENQMVIQKSQEQMATIDTIRKWTSYIVLGGVGCICLPQTFPRMYMGKSVNTQKKVGIALTASALWCVTFIFIGMIGAMMPGLTSDSQTALFDLVQNTGSIYLLSLTYIVLIAAAMGTMDITLLSLSTILTADFLKGFLRRREIKMTQLESIRMSRGIILLLSLVCYGVVNLYDGSIIGLALVSYEFVAQLFPVLIYALYATRRFELPALAGLVSGLGVSALFNLLGQEPFGFAPGLIGLGANAVLIVILHRICSKPRFQRNDAAALKGRQN